MNAVFEAIHMAIKKEFNDFLSLLQHRNTLLTVQCKQPKTKTAQSNSQAVTAI